jgi:hypothetical protein
MSVFETLPETPNCDHDFIPVDGRGVVCSKCGEKVTGD